MHTNHGSGSPHPGKTTGTRERPPTQLADAVLTFDLAREAAPLHEERAWQEGDRNARTLVKEAAFRIVLIALRAGTRMERHQAAGPISVQVLAGHVHLHAFGETVDLPKGHMVALERDVPHDVEALEDSTLLLTIAWQGEHHEAADGLLPS